MKNKTFLSFALLVAANAFIATPAMAFNLFNAAKVAGKAALGVAALSATVGIPLATLYTMHHLPFELKSIKLDINLGHQAEETGISWYSPWVTIEKSIPAMPAIWALVGITSLASGYAGYKALKSAWNDFKNINQ